MSVIGALVGVVVGLAVLLVLLWYFKRHRPEAKRRAEMRLRAEMSEGNRTRAASVSVGRVQVRTRTASSLNPTFARQGEAWVTFSTHPRSIATVKDIIAELGKLGIPANRCYYQSEIPTDGKSTAKTRWSVAMDAGFVVPCFVGTEYVWSRPLCHQWLAADTKCLVLSVDTNEVVKQALRSASVQHTGKSAMDTGVVREFYSTGGQGENLVEGHTECQSSRSVAITIIERILTFVPPADVQTNSTDPPDRGANRQENEVKTRHLECVKLIYENLPERVWDGIAVTHPKVRDLVTEATHTKFVDDPYADSVSPHTVAARLARDQARRMPQESLYDAPHDDSLPMAVETPPPKPTLPNTVASSGAGRSGGRQTTAPASPGGYKKASAIASALDSVDDVAASPKLAANYVNAVPFLEQQHRDQAAKQARKPQQQRQQQQSSGESYDNHVPFKIPPPGASKRGAGQAAAFSGANAELRLAGGQRRPKSSAGTPQSRGSGQTAAFGGAQRPRADGGARPKSLGSSMAAPEHRVPIRPRHDSAAPTDAPPSRGTHDRLKTQPGAAKSPGVVYLDHKPEAAVQAYAGPPGMVYIEHNPNYGAVGDDTDV